jgi:hypothetical protein
MRLPSILLRICIALFIFLMIASCAIYYFILSPSTNLRQVLRISKIPTSVRNVRMEGDPFSGKDVDGFYFTIAPDDFQKLLVGRQFQCVTSDTPREAKTMDFTVSGHSYYSWKTNSADCTIFTDDSHEHVIVRFGAD